MGREKIIFFTVREKSRNCESSQKNLKFYLKLSEKSGNFTFDYTSGFRGRFLSWKAVVVSVNSSRGIYFCCPIAGSIAQGVVMDGK